MRLSAFLERLLEWVVVFLMTALSLTVIVGVVFRKAGAALVWYDETASILLAWLTFYGAALAVYKKAHIGFPNLIRVLPFRLRLAGFLIREFFVIGFFLLVAWAGWRVLTVLQGMSMVSLPWVPAVITHSAVPLGALLFLIAELGQFRARLREVVWDAEREAS